MFPVEAHATMRIPRASARVMHAVMPRSLKEPVGLLPWCLTGEVYGTGPLSGTFGRYQ